LGKVPPKERLRPQGPKIKDENGESQVLFSLTRLVSFGGMNHKTARGEKHLVTHWYQRMQKRVFFPRAVGMQILPETHGVKGRNRFFFRVLPMQKQMGQLLGLVLAFLLNLYLIKAPKRL